MPRVLSVHEYELREEVDPDRFEEAVREARERGLFALPGLEEVHFLRGLRGERTGKYAAVWIYESRRAWESLWGAPDDPPEYDEYPDPWKIWEREVLAPFLVGDPDRITYTSYESLPRE